MNEPIRDIEILNRDFSVEKWTWAMEPDGHLYMYYNEDKLHRAWCDGGCVFAAILSPDRWVDIVNEEDGSWELMDLEPEDMVGVPTAVAIALSCAYTGVPTPRSLAHEVLAVGVSFFADDDRAPNLLKRLGEIAGEEASIAAASERDAARYQGGQ